MTEYLNEGRIEYVPERDFYRFSRKKDNNTVFVCPGSYFRSSDDTDYVRYCVNRCPYVASFCYFRKIGDTYRAIAKAKDASELEKARVDFLRRDSYYVDRQFVPMVIDCSGGTQVTVKGLFRLSSHPVNPRTFCEYANTRFGISVVFMDCTFVTKKPAKGDDRSEIWEYVVDKSKSKNVDELYKRVFNGTPVTKQECDEIMGVPSDQIKGGGENIATPWEQPKPKKEEDEYEFTIDDVTNGILGQYEDRNTGERFDIIGKYGKKWAVDQNNYVVYLIKKRGNISRSNKYPIKGLDEARRMADYRMLKERIYRMVVEALFG